VNSAEEGRIEWRLCEGEVTAFSEPFIEGIEIFIQMKAWTFGYVIYN
jgi:hypothetical protein